MHFQKALDEVCYDEFSEDPFYLAVPEIFRVTLSLSEGKVVKGRRYKATEKIPFVMVASRQKLRQVADEILEKPGSARISALHYKEHGNSQTSGGREWELLFCQSLI